MRITIRWISGVAAGGLLLLWFVASGNLGRELALRRASLQEAFGRRAANDAPLLSPGQYPGFLAGSGLVDASTFGDSSLILVSGPLTGPPDAHNVGRLVEFSRRLVAYHDLPTRVVSDSTPDARQALRAVAHQVGIPAAWPSFYIAFKGTDSLAFRAGEVLPLDDHRQVLSQLHPTPDRLQPQLSMSADEWTTAISVERFQMESDVVDGVALLRRTDALVLLEADCSVCRVREHVFRLRQAGLDTNRRVVLIVTARYADVLRGSLPAARIAVPMNPVGVAPALGLVSRDVAAADPVILETGDGRVQSVRRLANEWRSGAR